MMIKPKIQVAIRKRPLTKRELKIKTPDIIEVIHPDGLFLKEDRKKVDLTKYTEEHAFKFDSVFNENNCNEDIYKDLLKPLVESVFEKGKVSCFAYGQTGSGKTYTMMGDIKEGVKGLYLLAAEDLFNILEKKNIDLRVGLSFYEIYCDKAYDLLNDREECPIRVDKNENVNIIGLNEKYIGSSDSLMSLINIGLSERVTGKTGMNNFSSRSHAILQITLRSSDTNKLHGKLSFIDLAGSERGADVKDTDKQTRMDGAEINKSLLALKECIRALDMGKKHLPFRGSKLTLVLKDSFIGKSSAIMIGNISPALDSCEHTLNTLRYADRVKSLKSDGKKNKNLADELMLARGNNNRTEIFEKPKVDTHIVFEEYDCGKKVTSDKHVSDKHEAKSEEKREKSKPKDHGEYKRDMSDNVNRLNPSSLIHKSSRENMNGNLNFNQNNIQKLNFQKKNFLLNKEKKDKHDDEDDDFEDRNGEENNSYGHSNKSLRRENLDEDSDRENPRNLMRERIHNNHENLKKSSSKKKNNFLVTKNQISKSPIFNNVNNNTNTSEANGLKESLNRSLRTKLSSATNFLNSSNRDKSPYQKKQNVDFEDLGETKQKLIETYSRYIDEVFSIAKSDMRNIESIKKTDDFEMNFNKMKSNLDKKIRAINKMKTEILKVAEIIKKKESKRNHLTRDNFFISNQIPEEDDNLLI
jgi:hypothetical protein